MWWVFKGGGVVRTFSLWDLSDQYRAIYKVFDLVRHFVLATQGLLGRCTFVMEIMS